MHMRHDTTRKFIPKVFIKRLTNWADETGLVEKVSDRILAVSKQGKSSISIDLTDLIVQADLHLSSGEMRMFNETMVTVIQRKLTGNGYTVDTISHPGGGYPGIRVHAVLSISW